MHLVNKAVLAIGVLLITSFAHCETDQTARQAVDNFLALMDEGAFDASYERTAPVFRAEVSLTEWVKSASTARSAFGAFKSRELIRAQYMDEVPGAPTGDYVIFQFKSKFQKKKKAIETITPVLVNGRWAVSGYYIR